MKVSKSFGRMMISAILMIGGVFIMAPNGIVNRMIGTFFTDNLFQLSVGIAAIVIGFVVFTRALQLSKRNKMEKTYQKSKHRLIEIFGL